MTARLPPELCERHLTAWNAINRAWDSYSGSDSTAWPAKRAQFAAELRHQLTYDDQGPAFREAALAAIARLEKANTP